MLKGISERQDMPVRTEERWAELRQVYYAMCARVDHHFNLIVQALEEQGLYYEAAIFVFGDRGDFTGNYGLVEKNQNTLEECLTHASFIVKPPKCVPVEQRLCDALVELM